MEKGGGGQGASGGKNQIAEGIYRQEASDSSGVGGPLDNIRGLCKRFGICGRGEVAGAVVVAGGCGATTGGHIEKDFASIKVAAATGIRQAWQGQGRRGGGRSWVVLVIEGRERFFLGILGRRRGTPR